MSKQIKIVKIDAIEGERDVIEKALDVLKVYVDNSDIGCSVYEVFNHSSRPNKFIVYEEWDSPADWDAYLAGEMKTKYREDVVNAIEHSMIIEINGTVDKLQELIKNLING